MNFIILISVHLFLHGLVYYSLYVVAMLKKARLSNKFEKISAGIIVSTMFLTYILLAFKFFDSSFFSYHLMGMWMLATNLLFYFFLRKIDNA